MGTGAPAFGVFDPFPFLFRVNFFLQFHNSSSSSSVRLVCSAFLILSSGWSAWHSLHPHHTKIHWRSQPNPILYSSINIICQLPHIHLVCCMHRFASLRFAGRPMAHQGTNKKGENYLPTQNLEGAHCQLRLHKRATCLAVGRQPCGARSSGGMGNYPHFEPSSNSRAERTTPPTWQSPQQCQNL